MPTSVAGRSAVPNPMLGSSLGGRTFLVLPLLALAAQRKSLYVGPLGGHYDMATAVYKPGLRVQLTF